MFPKQTLARFLIKLNYEKSFFVTNSDCFLHAFCLFATNGIKKGRDN